MSPSRPFILRPVATSVAVASILGTKLAVRFGTKLVVTSGLVAVACFYAWVSTASATTGYGTIALQMVILGTGMGFTSAPATEAIMGVVPAAKAGVGSAVNDATRILGGTLGVAVIGSVYASLYASRLRETLPAGLPDHLARTANDSVGGALGVSAGLADAGQGRLAAGVHDAASTAFFHGFAAANLVAAGVAAAGAVVAFALLPSQPTAPAREQVRVTTAPGPVQPAPATLDR